MIIHLGPPLPTGSSSQPRSSNGQLDALLYLALLQVGFAWPTLLPGLPVRSCRTGSTLPRPEGLPTLAATRPEGW